MKIFGIGLSKTGTTSLARALAILGYKVKDNIGVDRYTSGDLSSIRLSVIDSHEAITDTPVPSFYKALDKRYPGSKFVLTIRDTQKWLASCRKQFNDRHAAKQSEAQASLFYDLYGCNIFDEAKFKTGYDRFVTGVFNYFTDRPDDLLVMNIADGDGWDVLCPFLGKPIPQIIFPKANVTNLTWIDVTQIARIAKGAGQILLEHYSTMHGDFSIYELKGSRWRTKVWCSFLRVFYGICRNNALALNLVQRSVTRLVRQQLMQLTPDIPIISSDDDAPPHSRRQTWNHLWLVNVLEGETNFVTGKPRFAISISLIQDGYPYIGVVLVVPEDTLFFARSNGSAYKVVGKQSPILLTNWSEAGNVPVRPCDTSTSEKGRLWADMLGDATELPGTMMCAFAEAPAQDSLALRGVSEREIAGAHAVMEAVGLTVIDCATGDPLRYNNADLRNVSCVVRRSRPRVSE